MDKTAKYVSIALVVMVAVGVFAAFPNMIPTPIKASFFEGFSVLSLSKVDFSSNDPTLNSPSWVLAVVQNSAGQSATGLFSKDSIKADGKLAQSDIRITTDIIENYAEYSIRNDFQDLFYIESFKSQPALFQSGSEWCTQNGAYAEVKPQWTFNTYCLRKSGSGAKGTVSSANQIFKSRITTVRYSPVLETSSVEISNIGQTSGILSGNVGRVSWVGSLSSGIAPPQPTDQDICALYTQGSWKTIDCSDFQTWKSSLDAQGIPTCVASRDEQQFNFCIQDTNSFYSTVNQGKQFTSQYQTGQSISGTPDSGIIRMNLTRQLLFPLLTFYLKTDWVGITIPVGKPDIISASSEEFKTGSDGFIKVTVKNIGDSLGSFDIYVQCQSPFSSSDRARITLDKGLQTDVYLRLTASVPEKTSGTCIVIANDVNNPNNKDSETVSVSASNIAICQAGQKRVYGKYIQQCSSSGSGWDTVKVCKENEYADPVTFECISNIVPPPPPPPPPPSSFDLDKILQYILVFTVVIVGVGIAYKLSRRKRKRR